MARQSPAYLVISFSIVLCATAHAEDPNVRIELSGGWTSITPNLDSYWAEELRLPSEWVDRELDSASDPLTFSIKAWLPVRGAELFFGYEREPEFVVTTTIHDPIYEKTTTARIDVATVDVGVGFPLRLGTRIELRPWVGPTYLQIAQSRDSDEWYGGLYGTRVHSVRRTDVDGALLGLAYGVHIDSLISRRIAIVTRVVQRWGYGDQRGRFESRSDTYQEPYTDGDAPISSREHRSTSSKSGTIAMMYGFDLGLRGAISSSFSLEGGWRYRNWTYWSIGSGRGASKDNGPGVYDGPYLRGTLNF